MTASGDSKSTSTKQAVKAVEEGLRAFAVSENIPADTVDRAIVNAEAVIARHGLTVDELMRLGFDPVQAVAVVNARAATTYLQFGEADAVLCRRIVEQAYGTLVKAAVTLPDFTGDYRREVLQRLQSLDDLPDQVRSAVVEAHALDLLTDPSGRWQADRFPSSTLLRPEFGVVPFWGRTDTLADLAAWIDSGSDVTTRLYVGDGGMGKTRLAIESCRSAQRAGWRAGFLSTTSDGSTADQLTILGRGTRGVVVTVDYAETRTLAVGRLVGAALATKTPVRILLLARKTGEWWERLRQLPDAVGDYLCGPAVTFHSLPPLAHGSAERHQVFTLAAEAFNRALHPESLRTEAPPPPDDLTGTAFDRVLFLLLSALATVEGDGRQDGRGLLDHALRREQRFWDVGLQDAGLDILAGRPIRQAAALVTLAGRVDGLEDAMRLLTSVPMLSDQPQAALWRVVEVLRRLYPGEGWLNGVQPDLLGEHLVARAVEEDARLLTVFNHA
ncbi:hypothetical protein ACIBG5_34460 [Kribbella sp. NPDC050241]|uniref:hypothetical protein n=1 Tax=Kribbella sp. NPDC050241 TaxID=3364115 RepID=UPI00379D4B7F